MLAVYHRLMSDINSFIYALYNIYTHKYISYLAFSQNKSFRFLFLDFLDIHSFFFNNSVQQVLWDVLRLCMFEQKHKWHKMDETKKRAYGIRNKGNVNKIKLRFCLMNFVFLFQIIEYFSKRFFH